MLTVFKDRMHNVGTFENPFMTPTEHFLKERSSIMFEEISSGVYHVVKDRFDRYGVGKFVDSRMIASSLDNTSRTVVKRLDGMFISNDDFKDF